MIEVLSKPADQITIRDIEALIESKVPEGDQIEFKESLSTRGDSTDPWMSGGDLGDRAKDAILEEAVAFANAYSGTLLLGIGESDTKPSVAAKIPSLPRCAELAERLRSVFHNRVEPQLPRLDIFAVPTKGDGGVIVISVGRSRRAPHCVKFKNKRFVCPIRRSDRCDKMTMREIQDMTLNVSRGLERLEKRLSERSERFQQEFKRLKTPEDAFGIRMTATPVGDDIRFERVFRENSIVEELDEPWRNILYRPGSGETGTRLGRDGYVISVQELMSGRSGIERVVDDALRSRSIFPKFWRPRLRAARAEPDLNHFSTGLLRNSYREIHYDGLIELGFVEVRQYSRAGKPYTSSLSPNLLMLIFANLVVWADRVRHRASVPTAEYALEVEICAKGGSVQISLGQPEIGMVFEEGKLQPGSLLFPRYPLGSHDEIPTLLGLFDRDFRNSYGKEILDDQGMFAIQNWPE